MFKEREGEREFINLTIYFVAIFILQLLREEKKKNDGCMAWQTNIILITKCSEIRQSYRVVIHYSSAIPTAYALLSTW